MEPGYYVVPTMMTMFTAERAKVVRALEGGPEALCRVVQGLVALPPEAEAAGLPASRLDEKNLRPADGLLHRLLELDGAAIDEPRPIDRRVVGTCRHLAVLACALLRAHGLPARARCGFAGYFTPGRYVDHWITEHWDEPSGRWRRIDSEILGTDIVPRPADLAEEEFLSGGEAWQRCRSGQLDPTDFGIDFATLPDLVGPAEIRGNAIRDLAALNKVEMLPWDEWGPMRASYDGTTGPDFDELIDEVAETCASDDTERIHGVYADLAVPEQLVV
ncbi:MAG: transglutaminase domain-containing protein [Acidimicrobiales bacterium]